MIRPEFFVTVHTCILRTYVYRKIYKKQCKNERWNATICLDYYVKIKSSFVDCMKPRVDVRKRRADRERPVNIRKTSNGSATYKIQWNQLRCEIKLYINYKRNFSVRNRLEKQGQSALLQTPDLIFKATWGLPVSAYTKAGDEFGHYTHARPHVNFRYFHACYRCDYAIEPAQVTEATFRVAFPPRHRPISWPFHYITPTPPPPPPTPAFPLFNSVKAFEIPKAYPSVPPIPPTGPVPRHSAPHQQWSRQSVFSRPFRRPRSVRPHPWNRMRTTCLSTRTSPPHPVSP